MLSCKIGEIQSHLRCCQGNHNVELPYNFNVLKMSTLVAWHALPEKLFTKTNLVTLSFYFCLSPFMCQYLININTPEGELNIFLCKC